MKKLTIDHPKPEQKGKEKKREKKIYAHCRRSPPLSRLPNGPGRLASFGAPNDGPVRGRHFGGLVRPGTESEYPGPDIDDCSYRIRF